MPVCKPEDLPKGVLCFLLECFFNGTWVSLSKLTWYFTGTRKEVRVGGVSVLLFWYRQQIYAIESRHEPSLCLSAAHSQPSMKQS